MKHKMNFYDNDMRLVQYVVQFRVDDLDQIVIDHVTNHKGERLSQKCGQRVFEQEQKGLIMESEVLGHSDEVPEKYRYFLNMGTRDLTDYDLTPLLTINSKSKR